MDDITRAGVLSGFGALVRSLGKSPSSFLAKVGLSDEDLDNPDHYISRPATIQLLELAAEGTGCPDFGLRLAAWQDVNIIGALAFQVRAAPNLRSAIGQVAKYRSYQAPATHVLIQPTERSLEERVVFDLGYALPAVQMTERIIRVACRINEHLTRGAAKPTRVLFSHAPASAMATYRSCFGVRPEFSQPFNAYCLKASDLDRPLPAPDPHLQLLAERYLETHPSNARRALAGRAHQSLLRLMRLNARATLQDLADALRLHPRTLQRRLANEDASFASIRDGVRRDLALSHLASDVASLTDVAHLLGYSDQSVLTRSSMRWFGEAPMAVRRRLRDRKRTERP